MADITLLDFTGADLSELEGLEDRSSGIVKASAALSALSIIAVSLRLWSRKLIKVELLWSDWVLLLALVFSIGFSALEIVAAHHGLGRHILRNTFDEDVLLLQILFAEDIVYTIALTSTKISMLLLYRTIFPTSRFRIYRILAHIVTGICLAWGIATLTVGIFSCSPIADYWNIFNPHKNCIDLKTWYLGTGVANAVTDAMILALPILSVWQLQLSWKQKLSVSGLFLLGGFVVIASVIRLVALVGMKEPDITWSYYGVAIWSVIEVNIAVISTCLPTMRPLILVITPYISRCGLNLRSFVPGTGHRRKAAGYMTTSDNSLNLRGKKAGKVPGRLGTISGTAGEIYPNNQAYYPHCETKVESEPMHKHSKRGPRRLQSDEEMAELVPIARPPDGEGGIMVQKDVVQTWRREDRLQR